MSCTPGSPCPKGTLVGCNWPDCDSGPNRPDGAPAPVEDHGHVLNGDRDA